MLFRLSCLLLAAGLIELVPRGLQAQSGGLIVGAATGFSASYGPPRAAEPRGRYHSLLVLGFAPPGTRLEWRADVMWVHWASYTGPVSVTANAILPIGGLLLGGGRLRPYVLAGYGVYGVGSSVRNDAVNAGGGLRFELDRASLFVEGRRHLEYRRDFLTLGLTLRP